MKKIKTKSIAGRMLSLRYKKMVRVVSDKLLSVVCDSKKFSMEKRLWKKSMSFLWLSILVNDSNGTIWWEDIAKYSVFSEKWKFLWICWGNNLRLQPLKLRSLRHIVVVRWTLNLERVDGLMDLWDLEVVDGRLVLWNANIKSLWKLRRVWMLRLANNKNIKYLWDLEKVIWDLDISDTDIKSLGMLKIVWNDLNLTNMSKLKNLENLSFVWWNLCLRDTKLKSLWRLKKVWWDFDLEWILSLTDLWELSEVGGIFDIRWTSAQFQKLVVDRVVSWDLQVKWYIKFWWNSQIINNLSKCEFLPWSLYIQWYVKSLWKIKSIDWNLIIQHPSKFENIWVLESVWGDMMLSFTWIKHLWRLRKVWWNLFLNWLNCLDNIWWLSSIWWTVFVEKSNIRLQYDVFKKNKYWLLAIWNIVKYWYWYEDTFEMFEKMQLDIVYNTSKQEILEYSKQISEKIQMLTYAKDDLMTKMWEIIVRRFVNNLQLENANLTKTKAQNAKRKLQLKDIEINKIKTLKRIFWSRLVNRILKVFTDNKKWTRFIKTTIMSRIQSRAKNQIQKILWSTSDDFLYLKWLIENSKWKISWQDIKDSTTFDSYNHVAWIYWQETLDLKETNVKNLWKIKRIMWWLDLCGMDNFEDIWDLKYIWWYLDIRWINSQTKYKIYKQYKENKLKVMWKIYMD